MFAIIPWRWFNNTVIRQVSGDLIVSTTPPAAQ